MVADDDEVTRIRRAAGVRTLYLSSAGGASCSWLRRPGSGRSQRWGAGVCGQSLRRRLVRPAGALRTGSPASSSSRPCGSCSHRRRRRFRRCPRASQTDHAVPGAVGPMALATLIEHTVNGASPRLPGGGERCCVRRPRPEAVGTPLQDRYSLRPGARSDGLPVVARQFDAPGFPKCALPPSGCPGPPPL